MRLQTSLDKILTGIVRHDDYFDAVMCNPQMGEFEPAFVGRMIQESTAFKTKAGAVSRRTIDMAQGQKRSRIVAWTFRGELGAKSGKKDGGAS